MRTIITKKIEIITCDICNEETEYAFKCQVCGKDTCGHCAAYNMCIECWEDNCSFATINQECCNSIVKHTSNAKWLDLLSRFHGKRVKITIEEFPEHEEVKLNYKFEAIDGDNTKEWLKKCASLGIK